MFWDIALAVLAAMAQVITGFLGWRVTVDGVQDQRKTLYEWLFVLASLIGVLAVGLAAYRGSSISHDLAELRSGQQTTNAGIQKIENTPPIVSVSPPIINIPAEQAFITATDAYPALLRLGNHIVINYWDTNLSPQVAARSVVHLGRIYVVKTEPTGIDNLPLVSESVQEKQYAEFLAEAKKGHNYPSGGLGPGQKALVSGIGPILDESLQNELQLGKKAIFKVDFTSGQMVVASIQMKSAFGYSQHHFNPATSHCGRYAASTMELQK